ncbi:MAG TPA: aldo/keto reductase, partial [Pirellulales bacterium]|nr:aldo/keto reductase [Pirellulales bacterium]
MTTNTMQLSGGLEVPLVGLGLWKIAIDDAPRIIAQAVADGYRHLDSACDYGNEPAVGAGLASVLRSKTVRREQLWVTSKLWNTYHEPQHVRPAIERTLRDLGLDYLDLYLIHFPVAQAFVPFEERYPPGWSADPGHPERGIRPIRVPVAETWGAMEEIVRAGLTRTIGVSNFGVSLLRDLLSYAAIRPAMLQVELHPFLAQEKLLRFCREERIGVTGFSPLGAGSYVPLGMAKPEDSVLGQPVVRQIAESHGRSPAQIVLRWGVGRGTAVIPKTSRPERLRENLAIFDFELTPDEMRSISALDRHHRYNDPGVFCEAAFHTFYP